MPHLYCPIRAIKNITPNRIALQTTNGQITYQMLDLWVEQTMNHLPFRSNQRIALCQEVDEKLIVCLFALFRLGVTVCMIPTRWPDEKKQWAQKQLNPDATLTNCDLVHPLADTQSNQRATPDLKNAKTILFTSGSTGHPKACIHTLSNHIASALSSNLHLNLKTKDYWPLNLPIYHVSGLSILFRCFYAGACVGLLKDLRFATHLSFVTTQLYRYLENPTPLPSLRCLLLGGSSIGIELLKKAQQSLPIYLTYGLTEMGSQVLTTNKPIIDQDKVYLGFGLNHTHIELSHKNELKVKGDSLFEGYLNHPRQSSWYHTKDLATFCPKKGYAITGRLDNLFISAGENIQPEQIEAHLRQIPSIYEAIVVPISDPEYGMRPCAFILTDGTIEKTSIQEHLRKDLPGLFIPKEFFCLKKHLGTKIKISRSDLQQTAQKLFLEQSDN